jgi:hypothetical protein
MNAIRSPALAADRVAQLLPFLFTALLLAGLAMQAKLLPIKPMPMEFPSSAGILPGAAPQESVAPASATLSFDAPPAVLPRESVPDENSAIFPEPSVAMIAPNAAGALLSPSLGLPGSGNLTIRSNRPHAVSALALNLLQTAQRVRATMRSRANAVRRPAAPKAQQTAAKRAAPLAAAAKASLPVSGLGGAAGSWGGLGGPAPMAASINGTTMRRKY